MVTQQKLKEVERLFDRLNALSGHARRCHEKAQSKIEKVGTARCMIEVAITQLRAAMCAGVLDSPDEQRGCEELFQEIRQLLDELEESALGDASLPAKGGEA